MGIGHAQKLDVVDIPALAGDETLVLLADDARANAFHTHANLSPTGVCCPAAAIARSGRGLGID